jgi:hypothetical protein
MLSEFSLVIAHSVRRCRVRSRLISRCQVNCGRFVDSQ